MTHTNDKIETLAAQIERMTLELEALQKKKEEEAAVLRAALNGAITESVEGRFAIFLHDNFCRHNHIDGCSWGYEIHHHHGDDWSGAEHARHLKLAKLMLNSTKDLVSPETLIKIFHDFRAFSRQV